MMDGYAVRAADTAGATREQPVPLRLVETIYTGRAPVGLWSPDMLGHRDRRCPARRRRRRGQSSTRPARANQVLVKRAVAPVNTSAARERLVAGESPSPTAPC